MKRMILCFAITLGVGVLAQADYLQCPPLPSGVHIRPENRFFDVVPKIVPANTEVTISIIPRHAHRQFKADCTYEMQYVPLERFTERSGWEPDKKNPLTPENGKCQIKMYFEGEQEHLFWIDEIDAKGKRERIADLRLYSLEPDLYALRPYKGDFHMHSDFSDGVESPAYVAGACRRAGLDFMALTDHHRYDGSTTAQKAYEGLPIDLRIYPGEEVHTPGNPVHIVSFGANASISDLHKDEAAYRQEVQAIQDKLTNVPPGANPFEYAASVWAVQKIRERGGLAMFCHTFWQTGDGYYYLPTPLTNWILDTWPFDAFELISGCGWDGLNEMDENLLQVAQYQEACAKGKRLPVCGISDVHGIESSDTFGRYYTVCFSPTGELADLQAAIKGLNSVAVEALHGELPRAYGPFRLVKFATFLLREVFPQHDELCLAEGLQMIQHAAGDAGAVDRLRLMQGQTKKLYDMFWSAAQ